MEKPRPGPSSVTQISENAVPVQRTDPGEPLTMGSMPTGEDLRPRKVKIGNNVYIRTGRNTIIIGDRAYRFNADGTYTPMKVLSGHDIEGDARDEEARPLYQYDPAKAPKEE